MAERKAKFGTQAALTISLASLANGAGRVSTQVDLTDGSGLAADKLMINFITKSGAVAPTAGTTIEFYLVRGDEDGTTVFIDAALGASDAAVSDSTLRDQLQLVYALPVTATTAKVYTGSFVIDNPGARFSLMVWNGVGQTLDTTAGSHVIRYTPIVDSIV